MCFDFDEYVFIVLSKGRKTKWWTYTYAYYRNMLRRSVLFKEGRNLLFCQEQSVLVCMYILIVFVELNVYRLGG